MTEPIVYESVVNDDLVEEEMNDSAAFVNYGLSGTLRPTTTATGARAKAYRDVRGRLAPQDPTWDAERTVRFIVDLQPPVLVTGDAPLPESIDDMTAYFTSGDVEAGKPGFGFKLSMVGGSPTLQGVVHDGDTETTTDLSIRQTRLPDSGRLILRAEYMPAPFDVTFYVDDRRVGDSSDLDPLTESAAAPERFFTVSIEAGADVRRAVDFDARVVQQ